MADIEVLKAQLEVAGLSQFESGMRSASSSVQRTSSDINQAGAASGRGFMSALSNATALGIGAGVAGGAILGMFAGGLGMSVGFEHSMVQVAASLGGVGTASGITQGQFEALNDEALRIGATTSLSASEAGGAFDILARAGVSVTEILGDVENGIVGFGQASVNFAEATGSNLQGSAELIAAVSNMFAGEYASGALDAAQTTDILTAAMNNSSATLPDMQRGINALGPTAAALGIPFQDMTAGIAYFNSLGIPAADAGVSMARALTNMANPTAEATTLMDDLGLSFFDAQGQFIGFPAVADQLKGALSGMTDEQQQAAITTIFGAEAMDVMTLAALNGGDGIREMTAALAPNGQAAEQAAARMNSTAGSIEQLKGAVEVLAITFLSGLNPAIRFVADALSGFVSWLLGLPGPVQTVITMVAGLAGVALTLGGAFILLGPQVMAGVDAFKVLAGITPRAAAGTALMGPAGATAAGGMNTANIAGRSLRATMLGILGPVALVAAAAYAVYQAYQHNFLGFGDLVRGVGSKIKDVFTGIVDGVTGFVDRFTSAFDALVHPVTLTQNTLNMFGLDMIPNLLHPMQMVEGAIHALATAFRGIGGGDIPFFNTLADWLDRIAPQIQAFVDEVQAAWDWLGNVFKTGNAEAGLEKFSGALKPIMNGLGKIVDTAHDLRAAFSKGGFLGVLKAIPDEFGDIMDGLDLILDGVGEFFTNLGNKFPALGRTFAEIGRYFERAGDLLRHFGDLFEAIFSGGSVEEVGRIFGQIFGDIGNLFLDLGRIAAAAIADIGSLVQDGLGQAFDWLSSRFDRFSSTFDMLGGVITNIVGVVRNLAEALLAAFSGDWSGVWENLQDAFVDAVQAILSLALTIPTFLLELFTGMSWSEIGAAIKDAFTDAWDAIKEGASGAWDAIVDTAQSIGSRIGDAASALMNWGRGVIQGAIDGAQEKWGEFTGWLGGIATGIGEFIGDVKQGALDKLNGIRDAIGDALTNAQTRWEEVKTWLLQLVGSVTGQIGDLKQGALDKLNGIRDAVGDALVNAQRKWDEVKAWLALIVGSVVGEIGDLKTSALDKLNGVRDAIADALSNAQQKWEDVKGWLGQIAGSVTGAIGDLYGGAITALNRIRDAIGDALLVAQGAWERFKGWLAQLVGSVAGEIGDLKQAALDKFNGIRDAVTDALGNAQGKWEEVKAWFALLVGSVAGEIGDLKASALERFNGVRDAITDALTHAQTAWDSVKRWFAQLIGSVAGEIGDLKAAAQEKLDGIKGAIDAALTNAQTAWESVKTWLGLIAGSITGSIGDLYASAIGAFGKIANAINDAKTAASGSWDRVVGFMEGIDDAITTALGGVKAAVDTALAPITAAIDAIQAAWDALTFDVPSVGGLVTRVTDPLAGYVPDENMTPEQQQAAIDAWKARGGGQGGGGGGKYLAGNDYAGAGAGLLGGSGSKVEIPDFSGLIAAATAAQTAFNTALGGIRTDSENARLAVTAALLGMQAGGLPPVMQLATQSKAQFDQFRAQAVEQANQLQMQVVQKLTGTQTQGLAQVLALQTGAAPKFSGLQTQGLGAITALQTGLAPKFTGMQTQGISSATALQSGALSQFTTLQSKGIGSTTTLNTGVSGQFSSLKSAGLGHASALSSGVGGSLSDMNSRGVSQALGLNSGVVGNMKTMQGGALGSASQTASGVVSNLGSMVNPGAAKASDMMSRVSGNIQSSGAAGTAFAIGQNIGGSLASGLESMANRVGAAAADLIGQANAAMNAKALIASPSRLFRATGQNIGGSVGLGIDDMAASVSAASAALVGVADAAMQIRPIRLPMEPVQLSTQTTAIRPPRIQSGQLAPISGNQITDGQRTRPGLDDPLYGQASAIAADQYKNLSQTLQQAYEAFAAVQGENTPKALVDIALAVRDLGRATGLTPEAMKAALEPLWERAYDFYTDNVAYRESLSDRDWAALNAGVGRTHAALDALSGHIEQTTAIRPPRLPGTPVTLPPQTTGIRPPRTPVVTVPAPIYEKPRPTLPAGPSTDYGSGSGSGNGSGNVYVTIGDITVTASNDDYPEVVGQKVTSELRVLRNRAAGRPAA